MKELESCDPPTTNIERIAPSKQNNIIKLGEMCSKTTKQIKNLKILENLIEFTAPTKISSRLNKLKPVILFPWVNSLDPFVLFYLA